MFKFSNIIINISLSFILLFFFGCSGIALRIFDAKKPPFDVEEGKYIIEIYEVKYPESILARKFFYEELDTLARRLMLNGNKISILINEAFFEDRTKIEDRQLTDNLTFLEKRASNLTDEDIEKLYFFLESESTSNLKVQEILNLQIKAIENLLEIKKTPGFNTELKKQELIDRFKAIRLETMQILKRTNIEWIVKIDDPYRTKELNDQYIYRFSKDIAIEQESGLVKRISQYNVPIYLTKLNNADIEKIFTGNLNLRKKHIIVENEQYRGYSFFNSRYVLYKNGDEQFFEFENYEIELEIKKIDLRNLVNINQETNLKELLK